MTIVQRVGHSFDPRTQSMRRGAILVRRYVRVLSPCLPTAFLAAAHMHLEQADFRLRRRRHVRHRCFFRCFPLQASTTERAVGLRDGNIDWRTAAGFGRRCWTAGECSLPWLAPRPLRILLALALGKRCGAALILASEFLDLLSQVLNLLLQLADQADKM